MSMNLKLIKFKPDGISFLVDAPNYDVAVDEAIRANESDLLGPPFEHNEIYDRSNYTSIPIDMNTLGEIMEINKYYGNYNGVLVLI